MADKTLAIKRQSLDNLRPVRKSHRQHLFIKTKSTWKVFVIAHDSYRMSVPYTRFCSDDLRHCFISAGIPFSKFGIFMT